jgi:hypothetical protein
MDLIQGQKHRECSFSPGSSRSAFSRIAYELQVDLDFVA